MADITSVAHGTQLVPSRRQFLAGVAAAAMTAAVSAQTVDQRPPAVSADPLAFAVLAQYVTIFKAWHEEHKATLREFYSAEAERELGSVLNFAMQNVRLLCEDAGVTLDPSSSEAWRKVFRVTAGEVAA